VAANSPIPPRWPFIRDVVLFVVGILGIAYQTVVAASPDPSLLLVYAAMCGLPIVLHKDQS
jgi:hypothetical protein